MALSRAAAIAMTASIAASGVANAQAPEPAGSDTVNLLWSELAQGDRLALLAAGIVASICIFGGGVRLARYVRRRAPQWRPSLRPRPRGGPPPRPAPAPSPEPIEAPSAAATPSRDERRRLALEIGQEMQREGHASRPEITCAAPQPLAHAQAALTARIAAIGRRETEARRAKERAAEAAAAEPRSNRSG